MARKGRHSSRTGDGGAELRLQKQRAAAAEREQKEAELAFYDDPSGGEDASEDVDSDGSEFDGAEGALELGGGSDDDGDDDDDDDDDEDDDMEDFASEKKRIQQMDGKWGKSKKTFYSADTAEFELDSDEEAAKDEEDAALELQRKQAGMMDEEDFGFGADAQGATDDDDDDEQDEDAAPLDDEVLVGAQLADLSTLVDRGTTAVERVPRDFSKLSKKDKLEIVNQSAPELLGLVAELDASLKELREVLAPAIARLKKTQHTTNAYNAGVQFLVAKQSLLLNYVSNISFYLLLRAEGKSVADHPVLQHLLAVKKQLLRLQALDSALAPQLHDLLTKDFPVHADDGMAKFFSSTAKQHATAEKTQKTQKNQKVGVTAPVSGKKPKKAAGGAAATAEKAQATAFYAAALAEKAAVLQSKQALYTHAKPALEASDAESEAEGDGKRGASYEIIKNKGLKAHKSKLNRNPRVKKRMQFRKAVIRRKGQVRDVRVGEASKYGGETTGIKANLTRSRKIRN